MGISLFGLTFHLYGLVLGLAILVAFQASTWLVEKRRFDQKILEKLFWWVVVGGIIGARTYHVIDKWKEVYSLNPQSVFYLWNGGLGIWGAIGGGVVGLLVYWLVWLKKKTSLLNLLDVVFFGVPLGQAIGRWGNFFNNEIVGKNGEPLFLYESGLDLLLFFILIWVSRKYNKPGIIVGIYLMGYGLIRFGLEPMRLESMIWKIAGVPMASLVSVVATLVGVYLISQKRS